MDRSPALVLMYHQIVPDAAPDDWVPSPLADPRYGVRLSVFRDQMAALRDRGIPVVSLGDWVEGRNPSISSAQCVCIVTFDDGYASDCLRAAPVLDSMGFPATFFVSTGFVGTPGMLTTDQIAVLSGNPLFSVGSHGVTHRFLSDLSEVECRKELSGSLARIREWTGQSIVDLSAPGGRTDPDVAHRAALAGYRALLTSAPGVLVSEEHLFEIPRLPVLRHHSVERFNRLSNPFSFSFLLNRWIRVTRQKVRQIAGRPRSVSKAVF
ncbi:MAG: polysaccharide deacetylase family protein [Leptospirales bacterium]